MTQMVMALTGENSHTPYVFNRCGTAVYSLEEALYYTYTHFKYTDFTSERFINWVELVLKLPEQASTLKEIRTQPSFSQRLMSFLTLIPFFDPLHLASLKATADLWETENNKHILKEQGDEILDKAPTQAIKYYQDALENEDSADLYNNLGIAYANQFRYDESYEAFCKAIDLEPHNLDITLNLAYVMVETKRIHEALPILERVQKTKENSYAHFLYSKIYEKQKKIPEAIASMQSAISVSPRRKYFYELSNLYSLSRRYTDAIDILHQISDRDARFYKSLAHAYAMATDYPRAIVSLDKSIALGNDDADTLATLANYHRHNYNLDKALSIVEKAKDVAGNANLVKLEEAKIKKAQGKLRDYQKIMDNILIQAKQDYRRTYEH